VGPALVLYANLHLNSDLQAIGWALLLAGGASLLTDGIKQTRDLDNELGQWLLLHIINLGGVLVARFYIFPMAAYRLLDLVSATQPAWLWAVAAAGIGAMTLFNVVVFVLLTEKLLRNGTLFVSRAVNGWSKMKTT